MTTAVGPVPQTPPTLQSIRLELLHPHPANRKQFDPKQLQELAASLQAEGLLNAIIVRKHPDEEKHGAAYQIIAGDRRSRAAKLAGWTTIPASVRELDDHEALRLVVIDNLQRSNPTPLEEADGYKALEQDGLSIQEIALAVAKSPEYVHRRLQLLQLVPAGRKQLESEQISLAVALHLARMEKGQQNAALGTHWATRSEREIRRWFDENVLVDLARAPFSPKDAELRPAAGACTTCPKRTGAAPTLWGDLDKKDCCTDPGCFHGKVQALVQLRRTEVVRDHGEHPLFVSGDYYVDQRAQALAGKGAQVLAKHAYQVVKPGAQGAKPAIVVEGNNVGHVIHVKIGTPSRSGGNEDPGAARYKREQAAAAERTRKKLETRRAWLKAGREALAKLTASQVAKLDPLRIVLTAYVEDMNHDPASAIVKELGIEVKQRHLTRDALKAYVAKVKDPLELARLAVMLPPHTRLFIPEYGSNAGADHKAIEEFCRSVGGNAAAAAREVEKNFKAKADARAKRERKAKATKKRAGDVARAKKAKRGKK